MRQTQLTPNQNPVKFSGVSLYTGLRVNNKKALLKKKLKESEIRFRRLYESAKEGIIILDYKTGIITDANPSIIKILSYPVNEIRGKKLWEIGLFSNKEEWETAFKELKNKGYILFENLSLQRLNGNTLAVELVGSVCLVKNTKVIQCNIGDITHLKNTVRTLKVIKQKIQNTDYINLHEELSALNEELNESQKQIENINNKLSDAKTRAEESDKLKSAFLANINHEIRTPLNAVMGFSELLLRPGLTKEKLKNFVQLIKDNSLQLLSVINDIIDISKLESGLLAISIESFNINNLLYEIYAQYEDAVESKNLKLQYFCDHPNDIIYLKSDKNRLKQALCNLLNNALKFTSEGHIEFGYKIKENFIEFYVEDTGIGIAPENHALIFHPFRQLENIYTREYYGIGLGLSISKVLVENLGGAISVNSKPGKGSTFSFTVPYNNYSSVFNTRINSSITWNKKSSLIREKIKDRALVGN